MSTSPEVCEQIALNPNPKVKNIDNRIIHIASKSECQEQRNLNCMIY